MKPTLSNHKGERPKTIRRAWFIAREHFHDWMWDGGAEPRNPIRRAARRLPFYFSDPYWMSPREIEKAFSIGTRVDTTGPARLRLSNNTISGLRITQGTNGTVNTATSATFTIRDCRIVPPNASRS